MSKNRKHTPADIMDWLVNCVCEVDGDGGQTLEGTDHIWYVDGLPEMFVVADSQARVKASDGTEFLIRVTKVRKGAGR